MEPWYIALLVGLLVGAIVTRSAIVNLALIFAAILGTVLLPNLDASTTVITGLTAVFLTLAGFSLVQLLTKVQHL